MTKEKNYGEFDLSDWVEYIQQQHKRTMDLTLERVSEVWCRLGKPQGQFNIVVAGTNGKGSSIGMLEAVLTHAGKTTGVYTSPHLVRYNERVKINGYDVDDEKLCQAFTKVEQARESIPLTYFEYGTLCALLVFSEHNVQLALLEVGMGGRLDAVNMIDNDVALITSIGLDHELWLGSDRETIGKEKAGIIKQNGRVIFAGREIPDSIVKVAEDRQATLLVAGDDYTDFVENETLIFQSGHALVSKYYRNIAGLPLVMGTGYQADNLAGVVALLSIIAAECSISPEQIISGLAETKINGRCQIINTFPLVVIDVAHNADSVKQLATFLDKTTCLGNRLAVFGILEDKTLKQVIEPVLSLFHHWYLVGFGGGGRGQTSEELNGKLISYLPKHQLTNCIDPIQGYIQAKQAAKAQDQIVVFGSFYNAGDIIASFNRPVMMEVSVQTNR